jgi:hypothetical protein
VIPKKTINLTITTEKEGRRHRCPAKSLYVVCELFFVTCLSAFQARDMEKKHPKEEVQLVFFQNLR